MSDAAYDESLSRPQFRDAARTSVLVLVSAFGPYLVRSLSLRVDHVVVYSLFVGACVSVLIRRDAVMWRQVWVLLALWTSATTVMVVVTLLFGEAPSTFAAVAALETQTQPIAVLVVLGLVFRGLSELEAERLVRVVSCTIIVLMCANTVVSIASVYGHTEALISHFVTTDAVGSSVASRAASMGRYSGVFNQPGEAGIAYSVGVLAWVYMVVARGGGSRGLRVSLVPLVVGGLLTVSKVFVLGGLPLSLVYGLWESARGHPSRTARMLFWGGVSASAIGSLGGWAGWDYLMRLIRTESMDFGYLLRLYTAGRYGQVGVSAQGLFERTVQEAPLHGFGLGSFAPLDSGYVEFMYQGGVFSLALYVGVLLLLLVHALRAVSLGVAEGRLQLLLWILIVGGNFGAPVLTVNRASTIVWVLLMALMHASWRAGREDRRIPGGMARPAGAVARSAGEQASSVPWGERLQTCRGLEQG